MKLSGKEVLKVNDTILHNTTVANDNIFVSAVSYCGNNRCQNESTAE